MFIIIVGRELERNDAQTAVCHSITHYRASSCAISKNRAQSKPMTQVNTFAEPARLLLSLVSWVDVWSTNRCDTMIHIQRLLTLNLLLLSSAILVGTLLMFPQGNYNMLMFPQSSKKCVHILVQFNDQCMKAICEVDSGCLPEGCSQDSSSRVGCGYFRLNIYQYKVK
jgi:hypothetical protein